MSDIDPGLALSPSPRVTCDRLVVREGHFVLFPLLSLLAVLPGIRPDSPFKLLASVDIRCHSLSRRNGFLVEPDVSVFGPRER